MRVKRATELMSHQPSESHVQPAPHPHNYHYHKPADDLAAQERRRSPSRVSPRAGSPPRSPSWLKYKESPPRSPHMIILSPTRSPTERFPHDIPFDADDDVRADDVTRDEFTFPAMTSAALEDRSPYDNVHPPPKPARHNSSSSSSGSSRSSRSLSVDDVFDGEAAAERGVELDVASFAAAIASNTAHLTNMSDSDAVTSQPEVLQTTYFSTGDHVAEEASATIVTRPIGLQNITRQKAKPPADDWSPDNDLSPIFDVSPSVERCEHDSMLTAQRQQQQQQQQHMRAMTSLAPDVRSTPPDVTISNTAKPQPEEDVDRKANSLTSNDDLGEGHVSEPEAPFERQGGLVRSKLRFFAQASQSIDVVTTASASSLSVTSQPKYSKSEDNISKRSQQVHADVITRSPAPPVTIVTSTSNARSDGVTSLTPPLTSLSATLAGDATRSIRRSQSLEDPKRVRT